MKTSFAVLLSVLMLCGCATHPHMARVRPAIDLVAAGQDSFWSNGCILHVSKRNGASLQGIQLTRTTVDGHKTVLTADTGKVLRGSIEDASDENSVRLVANNVRIETTDEKGSTVDTAKKVTLVLERQM